MGRAAPGTRVEQAHASQDAVRTGGLRFEAHLPFNLALRVLGTVARGEVRDPDEAVFVLMGPIPAVVSPAAK